MSSAGFGKPTALVICCMVEDISLNIKQTIQDV